MPKIEKCSTTHIRIETDLKTRLDALAQGNESARDVIRRLLERYETEEQGKISEPAAAALTLDDIRRVIKEEITLLPSVNKVISHRNTSPVNRPVTGDITPVTTGNEMVTGVITTLTGDVITTKEAVFLWIGHEIETKDKDYDKYAARIYKFVKRENIEGEMRGRDKYYPREPIVKYIQDNPIEQEQESAIPTEQEQ